jgi:ankyrin repeat protein
LIDLIEKGQMGKNTRDEKGVSALTHAIDCELKVEFISKLIALGCDINLQDSSGQTPLHFAHMLEHYEAFEVLLKAGADPGVEDEDGTIVVDEV